MTTQQPADASEIEVVPGEVGASVYGPVEIAWSPDRLRITVLGAGRVSITDVSSGSDCDDAVIEVRPPSLDELTETVPGAD